MSPLRAIPLLLCGALLANLSVARAQTDPGVIEIRTVSNLEIVDNVGRFTVTVSRLQGRAGAVSAAFATADGTAKAGREYIAASGVLTWADGDAADQFVRVTIALQEQFVGTRIFTLGLSQPTGGATLNPTIATLRVATGATEQPTVTIASPPADVPLTAGDAIPYAVSVSDPSLTLAKAQLFLDEQLVGEAGSAGPFVFGGVAPAAGMHTLKAVAIDGVGATSVSTQTLTILAADPAHPSPSAAILTDLDGRAFVAGDQVTLSAAGVDADAQPLASLDFYANGVLFATVKPGASVSREAVLRGRPSLPRAVGDPVTAGAVYHAPFTMPGVDKLITMITVALNRAGQAKISAPVTFQSVASTSDHAPKVKLSGPGARVAVGAPVHVPATVTDADDLSRFSAANRGPQARVWDISGAIARMEYYLNGLRVKNSPAAPFGFDFSPPSAGVYVLSAIATDGGGLSTVSEPVTVEAVADLTTVSVSAARGGRVTEGGLARVTFTRAGGDLTAPLTVSYRIKGAAINGVDFHATDGQPLSGSIVIPAGASRKKLKVAIVADGMPEGTETVKIKVVAGREGSYVAGEAKSAKLFISDPE